jgi:hypothetical protein
MFRPVIAAFLFVACAAPVPAASPAPPSPGPPPNTAVATPSDRDAPVHAAGFSFTVSARFFANLAYHLDCLSGEIHCADDAFHAFWDVGWTPEDSAALAEWKHVRDAYEVSATLPGPVRTSPLPLPDASLDFDSRLRMASLLSLTASDYRQNLRILLPPADAERIARAAEHFAPRFDAFWKTTGEAVGTRFRAGLLAMLQQGDLPTIVARAARFYGTPLGDGSPIDFDLIVLPTVSKHSSGEQVMGHGIVEVGSDETPQQRMDVVCHELFHYFYGTRSPEQQAALMTRFLDAADSLSVVAYALLDESVATALGNGVIDHAVNPPDYARRLAREQGFYSVHSIDPRRTRRRGHRSTRRRSSALCSRPHAMRSGRIPRRSNTCTRSRAQPTRVGGRPRSSPRRSSRTRTTSTSRRLSTAPTP